MTAKPLYEEVIDEIGTQTLARFGLNIFSLRTYEAYGASVTMTNDTARAYNQHKNNDKYFGQTFEELDIGMQNIKDSLVNSGNKTYTTDTLADIKKTQEILHNGKNLANLNPKDRAKVEHILANYGDEVESMDFRSFPLKEFAHKNHNTTDTVTLDKNGNVINTAQLKVIKDTEGLLEERYLKGDNAVSELRMPYSDYKIHKENLEAMIEKGKDSNDPKIIEKAEKAKIALEKLNANNVCNRLMCENPRITAVTTQTIVAGGHIAQAGASDAIVVALSTLANGIIYEVKDMFAGHIDSETTILVRIKRLLKKVIESFKSNFIRGAGFGAIDAVIGVIGQIFKSIAGSLKRVWNAVRTSAKSIYNGIYSYVNGEIKNVRDLLKTILKSLFSAVWVTGAVGLEKQFEIALGVVMIPPFFTSVIAGILSIVVASFAVVITARSIDLALDNLFAVFAARDKAKLRAEEIAKLVSENLPSLIEERERLEQLMEERNQERCLKLESSFADYRAAYANGYDLYDSLNSICKMYGGTLEIKDMDDVREILQKPNRTGKLQWCQED